MFTVQMTHKPFNIFYDFLLCVPVLPQFFKKFCIVNVFLNAFDFTKPAKALTVSQPVNAWGLTRALVQHSSPTLTTASYLPFNDSRPC